MGCPRKDKPVTNSQKCLSYQKKLNREEYLQKEREHKWLQCSNLKQDPKAYKKYLQKDPQRKKQKVANITPLVQSLTLSDSQSHQTKALQPPLYQNHSVTELLCTDL